MSCVAAVVLLEIPCCGEPLLVLLLFWRCPDTLSSSPSCTEILPSPWLGPAHEGLVSSMTAMVGDDKVVVTAGCSLGSVLVSVGVAEVATVAVVSPP